MFPQIQPKEMLYSDNPAFMWLVKYINQLFSINMNVVLIQSHGTGKPFIVPINSTGSQRVVIWDRGGHYEALYLAR